MEIKITTITIETDNVKKGYRFIDRMTKKGFTYQSTMYNSGACLNGRRFKIELIKAEQFK